MFNSLRKQLLGFIAGIAAILSILAFWSRKNLEEAKEEVDDASDFDDESRLKQSNLEGQARARIQVAEDFEAKAKFHEEKANKLAKEAE